MRLARCFSLIDSSAITILHKGDGDPPPSLVVVCVCLRARRALRARRDSFFLIINYYIEVFSATNVFVFEVREDPRSHHTHTPHPPPRVLGTQRGPPNTFFGSRVAMVVVKRATPRAARAARFFLSYNKLLHRGVFGHQCFCV